MSYTITLVGAGACGVATFLELYQILQRRRWLDRDITIHVVDKKRMAEGLAFGTSQPGHLLNTSANLMGIFVNEPAHYGHWLREKQEELLDRSPEQQDDEQTFSPRRTYGAYLEEQYVIYRDRAREQGLTVQEHAEEAVDLSMTDDQVTVTLASGAELRGDAVVLALGTPKPDVFPHLQDKPHYIDFPWPSDRLASIPTDDSIGVIGSSLSAIDTLMTLADTQHHGKITLFSINGLLPKVQLVDNEKLHEREVLTMSNVHRLMREQGRRPRITELFRLFQQEVEQLEGATIDWANTGRQGQSAYELLEQDIRAAEEGTDPFQRVLYSLRYESSELWNLLDEEEQGRFNRWIGGYYKITRHCMPLINALRLRTFFEQEQLEVIGQSQDFAYDEENKEFVITTAGGEHRVSHLVNATGTATKLEQMKMPLTDALQEKSLVVAHPSGGVRANRRTLRLTVPDHPDALLYGVGQLLNGELLDTNAVWFNVESVERMVQDIVYELGRRSL